MSNDFMTKQELLCYQMNPQEDAEGQMLKSLAHDVSYKCILNDMKKTEMENRGDWRFDVETLEFVCV